MGFFRQEYWSGLPCPPRSSPPRDRTRVSCTVGRCFFTVAKPLLFSRSVASDSLRPHGRQQPGFPVLHYLQEFAQTQSIEWLMPSNHLILCRPLLLLLSIFPSIRVFSSESALSSDGQSHRGSPFTQSHLHLNSIYQRNRALMYIYFNFVEKGNQPRQSCEDIQLLLT